jgi:SET domain-containing protein
MADVTVGESEGRGRGVFAARRFEPNETIEICPVIVLSEVDARRLDSTGLYDYYFGWGKDGKGAAIVLGHGSLYNHSFSPNAVYHKNEVDRTMSFAAVKAIASGEEIVIRYNTGAGGESQQMWFEVK